MTRNHLAELVAALWPQDERRSREDFWFSQYAGETPYEVFDDVPADLRESADAAKADIAGHAFVGALIEE